MDEEVRRGNGGSRESAMTQALPLALQRVRRASHLLFEQLVQLGLAHLWNAQNKERTHGRIVWE